MADAQCPRCGSSTSDLQIIDGPLMEKLVEAGNSGLPSQVCGNCFAQLAGSVARGSVLLAREKAKEQRKLMLWKSRVALIKKARNLMAEKAFSDAAVAYEKYLRVLEVVFDAKPGELTPEHFKESARTQELTVVASAYWDLMRIYDTSEKYGDRMHVTAGKLAAFLKFTPIYPDIIRKAEAFEKTAKNPAVIKSFLKVAADEKGKCFIASSAFLSPDAPEVMALRTFRDQYLLPSSAGRLFVRFYLKISPPIARLLDSFPFFKPAVRTVLRAFVNLAVRHAK